MIAYLRMARKGDSSWQSATMRPVVAQGPGDSVKALKGTAAKGMILPFAPMALTFDRVSYYVAFPKVLLAPSIRGCYNDTLCRRQPLLVSALHACAKQACPVLGLE